MIAGRLVLRPELTAVVAASATLLALIGGSPAAGAPPVSDPVPGHAVWSGTIAHSYAGETFYSAFGGTRITWSATMTATALGPGPSGTDTTYLVEIERFKHSLDYGDDSDDCTWELSEPWVTEVAGTIRDVFPADDYIVSLGFFGEQETLLVPGQGQKCGQGNDPFDLIASHAIHACDDSFPFVPGAWIGYLELPLPGYDAATDTIAGELDNSCSGADNDRTWSFAASTTADLVRDAAEGPAKSTTTVRFSDKTIRRTEPIWATIRVRTGSGQPVAGKIAIFDRGDRIKSFRIAPSQEGRARAKLPLLAVGRHRISVHYLGSPAVGPSQSAQTTIIVRR